MNLSSKKTHPIGQGPTSARRFLLGKRAGVFILAICALTLASCVSIDNFLASSGEVSNLAHEACVACRGKSEEGDTCLICHPDYTQNHHPINFTPPESTLVQVDIDKFPLFGGKIRCFTCHTTTGPNINRNRKLLRGGPYEDNRELCFQCHSKDKYSEIDVHKMLQEDGAFRTIEGKLVCTFCHPQDINNLYTTNTVQFKADISFLCLRCHPVMRSRHIGAHSNRIPSEKVKATIDESEEKYKIILPLVPRGRISCATCHNPHQKGVLADERAMAGADSPYRLRTEKFLLCLSCHVLGK